MIEITSSVSINQDEIQIDFMRASGPGGQNVNKVSSAAQLRFDIRNSPSLEPEVKERLIRLAGSRVTGDGILIIEAKRYRTQENNKEDAIKRLTNLIHKAGIKPKKRIHTLPNRSSREKRLKEKKKKGEIKKYRRKSVFD